MQRRLQVGGGFRRSERLADGSRVLLRQVRPGDKELFRRGLTRLTPASRYRRFLSHRDRLGEAELAYLTELDGWDHVAIGALSGGDGVGVARFIRSREEPEVAEAAVAVIDALHGRGLGTLLLRHLAAAARERGIRRFRCDLLAENAPMRALLRRLSPAARERTLGGGVLQVDVPLC